ncbi:MAG: GTP-binding protein [Candidatus Lokiarchaeota archaeon]|nr:GTP-binding protein [Candidatus Lokiarchaeota archaeon]MBD3201773.1 GTP-binding protein [Candidatus Lokiarchaeota archaeon]
MSKKPIVLKILTAGEGGVGKTTLLHRYVEGQFLASTKMTIGVEFFLKELIIEDRPVTLQLWDFGGQDRFRFLLESYATGAKGALLMFDLTRPLTLDRLDQWVEICRSDDKNLPMLFLGTKLDLENEIAVNDDYAQELKEQLNLIDYLKISSKTGENVQESFELLTVNILKKLNKL